MSTHLRSLEEHGRLYLTCWQGAVEHSSECRKADSVRMQAGVLAGGRRIELGGSARNALSLSSDISGRTEVS